MSDKNDEKFLFRMDFSFEVKCLDEDSGTILLYLTPDPRRYELEERGGQSFYRDKFLGYEFLAEDMMRRMAEQASGMPLSFLSPSVRATPAYSEGRRAALEDELSGGGYRLPDEVVISHQELDANRDEAWTSFVAIDVCGSTPLRAESATKYDEAYALFFRELGTLVGQFNCRILKHTGDGLIAYIDHSSHNAQADNIIDFGSSALTLVREGINPPLLDAGLPAFNIRIGAEAGMAKVIGLSVPGAAYSVADFASDALNRAVKIEEGAGANEFRIGRGLYEALHVQWLVRATEVSPWRGAGHDTGAYRVD